MKTLLTAFSRFEQLDTTINRWLVANSSTLLRVCTGIALLEFGLVKFFYGSSPIDDIATDMLTGGLLSGDMATAIVAILECITGICFLSNWSLRLGVWLLAIQLAGALVPFVFFSNELLLSLFYTPTLIAQYIITEIILVVVGLFIAMSWPGARLVSEPERVWV